VNTTGKQVDGGGGTAFTDPPYGVSMDAANDVPGIVQSCTGPR